MQSLPVGGYITAETSSCDKTTEFALSSEYIAQSRLKEAITCDLFCRADAHAHERRKRALKLDELDFARCPQGVPPGAIWLVGPELAHAEQEAFDLTDRFAAQGWAVHLVTRLNAEAIPFEGFPGCTTHLVKPLGSYCDHIPPRCKVVCFSTPLSAALAMRGIKSICLVTPQNLSECLKDALWIPDFMLGAGSAGERRLMPLDTDILKKLLRAKSPAIPQVPHVPTVSACIIARDEEGMIEDCLESLVAFADETIVNDTGSRDATADIASRYGATVIKTEWHGNFADARNDALREAKCSHILTIDADERVLPGTALKAKIGLAIAADGWHVQLENRQGGGTIHIQLLRLFRNKSYHRYVGNIHEQVAPSIHGSNSQSPLTLLHLGYDSIISAVRQKRQRNIGLLLEQATSGTAVDPSYLDFQAALEMLQSGSYQEATTLLSKVLKEAPVRAEFRPHAGLNACRGYLLLGRVNDAHDAARQLLEEYPGFLEVALVVAEALIKTRSYDEADRLLSEARKAQGIPGLPRSEGAESYRLHTLLAQLKLGTGRDHEALREVVEALKACPGYNVAQVLLVSHWPQDAVRILREVSAGSVRAAVAECLSTGRKDLASEIAVAAADCAAQGEIYLATREFGKAAEEFVKSSDAWDQCRAGILRACGLAQVVEPHGPQPLPLVEKVLGGEPCGIGELEDVVKILGFLVDVGSMEEFRNGVRSLESYGDTGEVLIARIVLARGHLQDAYDRLSKTSDTPDNLPLKAEVASRLKRHSDAACYYAALDAARPLTVQESVRYVDCLVQCQQLDLARQAAIKAVGVYPEDPTLDRLARILGIRERGAQVV